MSQKFNKFPARIYAKTVLEPDLDIYKKKFQDALFEINFAHCIMLNQQNIINNKEAGLIIKGLKRIREKGNLSKVNFDGNFEDLFFLLEQKLIKSIGIDVAGKLHTGRSRNDMEHTMFRMELRKELIVYAQDYIKFCRKLLYRAEKGKDEVVLLYTHGQPAQPSTLGHYLGAVVEFTIRDIKRILSNIDLVNNCPMGAAAITTSGFPLDRYKIANLLGFSGIVENSYGAIAGCDYITSSYSSLKLSAIHLGRFIQDLITWTGFEVSQILVPDGFVQISSIMPQKRNPVPLEHLRLMLSLVSGGSDQIINTMHNTPFADMNDSEREVQAEGHRVFKKMRRVLPLLSDFIESIHVNKKSVLSRIDKSMATITELADTLVREEKISFRQAHEVAHEVSKLAIYEDIPLTKFNYEVFKKIFRENIGSDSILSSDQFRNVCSAKYFIEIRNLPGGPAMPSLEKCFTEYKKDIEKCSDKLLKIQKKLLHAEKSLRDETQKVLELVIGVNHG